MDIRKENIKLDKRFPFNIITNIISQGDNVEGVCHRQQCLEISYVKAGKGRYHIGDKIFEMGPGDIFIINNIEPRYMEVYDEDIHQQVLIFEPSLIWSNSGSLLDYEYLSSFFERDAVFSNKLDMKNVAATEIMLNIKAIEQEYTHKREGYEILIKVRLLSILTYLGRHFRNSREFAPENTSKRKDVVRLEEVLKYISENFNMDIKLEKVASDFHLTPQYFSSFFKKTMDMSFVDYINKIRVNQAVKLLKETDKKITWVATECGFNNTTNFNIVFRKFTGKTPSQYR